MKLVYPAIFLHEEGTPGYAAKYGKNAVKKTLTIPAWLNTFAEQNGISCSKVLQDALIKLVQEK